MRPCELASNALAATSFFSLAIAKLWMPLPQDPIPTPPQQSSCCCCLSTSEAAQAARRPARVHGAEACQSTAGLKLR